MHGSSMQWHILLPSTWPRLHISLHLPTSGTSRTRTIVWGKSAQGQGQVWGGGGKDVNRSQNMPWGWRQCGQPGLESLARDAEPNPSHHGSGLVAGLHHTAPRRIIQ